MIGTTFAVFRSAMARRAAWAVSRASASLGSIQMGQDRACFLTKGNAPASIAEARANARPPGRWPRPAATRSCCRRLRRGRAMIHAGSTQRAASRLRAEQQDGVAAAQDAGRRTGGVRNGGAASTSAGARGAHARPHQARGGRAGGGTRIIWSRPFSDVGAGSKIWGRQGCSCWTGMWLAARSSFAH
jgi:hypothetical protein